jgi:hypothetical protein
MRLLALLLLLMFAGTASATDYYVSTTGDNTTEGNITHPWQNISYATQQADAGDTIYLFNGTWYDEGCNFAHSGNATHPIILTAYNGTYATVISQATNYTGIGIDMDFNDYIKINNMTINGYEIGVTCFGNNTNISDCDIGNCSSYVVYLSGHEYSGSKGRSLHDIWIVRNKIHDTAMTGSASPNMIDIQGADVDAGRNVAYNYFFKNNDIYGKTLHTTVNLKSFNTPQYNTIGLKNVTFENNTIRDLDYGGEAFFTIYGNPENFTFHNNTMSDITKAAIKGYFNNSIFTNNSMINISDTYGVISLMAASHNNIFRYNTMSNASYGFRSNHGTNTNIIEANDFPKYHSRYVTGEVITDPMGKSFELQTSSFGVLSLKFTDGKVFYEDGTNDTRYYTDRSEYITDGNETVSITTYNITLLPTNDYLKNVTVNHESDAADDRTNISANSSVSTNPTTITATMQNASNTYKVSIDGGYVTQVVSSSAKVVTYQYTSSWSPHTFEFDWFSDAGWTPSNTSMYYNTSSTIEITTKTDGTNLFSRTPTEADGNATSGRLVVKTS